jgi:hypothetical protein
MEARRWHALYGQYDLPWLAWYDHARKVGVTYDPGSEARLDALIGTADLGWWWPYESVAILTDRPTELHVDPDGRLHHTSGPAIGYADGWGIWAWHGRRVPEWVITNPTPEVIAAEDNVEIRRCGIESMGWDRYVHAAELQLVASAPDPGNAPHTVDLYDVPERLWGDPVRLIVVTNGSAERDGSRRRYGLTTPAEISDPIAAVAWTVGESKSEYLATARRT